jgi:hypothetical protein
MMMLISVLGFGSIWTRRAARDPRNAASLSRLDTAYYNTTGVPVSDRIRNRPRVYGVARFNGHSGFRPDWTHRMIHKVFKCQPPCVWSGHNKVLFEALLASPAKPDAYLVIVTAEQSGGIEKDKDGAWLHHDVHLISFSECGVRQEVMLVMPPYTWLRGRLGTFFIEPATQKPWEARLILSSTI